MEDKVKKQQANEKYRKAHKEYYANYYREYRRTHKVRYYYGESKQKIKDTMEFLKQHSNNFTKDLPAKEVEELYNILDKKDASENIENKEGE